MKQKGQTLNKRRSKPTLKLATGQGHANREMSNNIEMRKRDTPPESSSARASRLMNRPGFSLDEEPALPDPVTPQTPGLATTSFQNLPLADRRNFLLLCVLYFLQGIPMGLATGSVPFLLAAPVVRADRGVLAGLISVFVEAALESYRGCGLEYAIWAPEELDHPRAGDCGIGDDIPGWTD